MKKRYKINIDCLKENMTNDYKLKADAFSIESDGYWISETDTWELTSENRDLLSLNYAKNNNVNLQDKSIYRFPNLNLPTQKVDLLKEKYNIKIIRSIDKADLHVISDKFITKLFEFKWKSAIEFSLFFNKLNVLKNSNLLSTCAITKLNKIILEIDSDSMINVSIPWFCYDSNGYEKAFQKIKDIFAVKSQGNNREIVISESNYPKYKAIEDLKETIIYDGELASIIDNQLAIINNDQYDIIEKMIQSNDRDNRSLALEMLANCNVDKSFDVVSGIFYWNYNYLKDTNNWNTVNVKSLRKKMDSYSGGVPLMAIWSYNRYINYLIKDNKLTKFALDKVRVKLYDNVLRVLVGNDASVFNVSLDNLNLKEELQVNLIKDTANV